MSLSQRSVLSVESLQIQYGSFHAVRDLTFQVYSGEIMGLLGPNGAGKTSTLSAIEGLVRFSSGKITVCGHDVKRKAIKARAAIGVQLQATSFQPELSVLQLLQLFSGLHGQPADERSLQTLLADMQLQDAAGKKAAQLSGGQQQRLSLTIATLHRPPLVILDEPTTGLDPQSRRKLWERIEALRDQGHAILLTTHSMEEAQAVCDRVAVIDHGRLIALDTPEGLIENHRTDPDVLAICRKGRVTLEDVFIALTGRTIRAH